MKRKTNLLFLAVVVAAASVANAYFEGFDSGVTPSDWFPSSGVSNTTSVAALGAGSLCIPTFQSVSNALGDTGTKVWTDFYTIPRPFQSDTDTTPPIDTTATAQFFVNTSGLWVTISSNIGAGGGYVTNVCTSVIGVTGTYPTATQNNVFYHISVLNDYSSTPKRWSLFVNDLGLATNLVSISQAPVGHEWFQVQNYGGNPSNVCYLDEFLVTNKVPPVVGNTNFISGTTIPQASVLSAFGSLNDPRPTNQTVGAAVAGISLVFPNVQGTPNDGRRYIIIGTSDPTLSGLASNGLISSADGTYSDSVLSGSTTRYFYEVVTLSGDGTLVFTNAEVYAAYKQTRAPQKSYRFGVPVAYANASDRTMGGALGEQLKAGLGDGDVLTAVDGVNQYKYNLSQIGPSLYWNNDAGLTPDPGLNHQWPQGIGFNVVRSSAAPSSPSTIFAGMKFTNTAVSVALVNGWSYLSWPYNDKTITDGNIPGLTPDPKDTLYLQQTPSSDYIPARYGSGSWSYGPQGSPTQITNTLHAGDGIMYKGPSAGGRTWTPPVP